VASYALSDIANCYCFYKEITWMYS